MSRKLLNQVIRAKRLPVNSFAVLAAVALAMLAGCATNTAPLPEYSLPAARSYGPQGGHVTVASWYGPGFNGRRTSSGEVYRQDALTAASTTLPLGSYARVTNLDNGKSVTVRINDRGPYVRGRGIDLSKGAAEEVGLAHKGVGRVKVAQLGTNGSRADQEAVEWKGRVRVRRRHHYHHYAARRAADYSVDRFVRNPVGWLMEVAR